MTTFDATVPETTNADALMSSIAAFADLGSRQIDADRLLAAEGAGHIVHDLPLRADGRLVALESRPWRLDPVPLVISGGEFTALADAAIARMQMLEAILVDLYGERELLRDAVVDPVLLWGSPKYRLAAFGQRPIGRWMTNYAVDVIRDANGRWHVVRDITDAPAGVGYALLGRAVTARVHRDIVAKLPAGRALRSLDPFADRLRDGLADVAATDNPRIVVLSGGVDHASFVEQSYLATRLGLNLVEGADLVVRRGRVWLRSLAGLEPVDVLFRRLEDDRIDPMEVNAEGSVGVPGLLLAARTGGVSLANAHGTGVLEDAGLATSWDDAGAWLATRHGRHPAAQPLRMLTVDERQRGTWSTYPGFDGSTDVMRAVTLRVHLVASDMGVDVLQGGSARVLGDGDDPLLSTIATAKDVWVVGGTIAPPAVRRREPLPQVDLIASVPTRAAEALFWAGRAMERAELVARSIHVVLDRTSGAIDTDVAEAWVAPGLAMIAAVTGTGQNRLVEPGGDPAGTALAAGMDALVRQLGSFLAEASSVREYFSVTAGHALARLAQTRGWLRSHLDAAVQGGAPGSVDVSRIHGEDLELVLGDLASIVGLWNESVVRGPAWCYGEVGRRLERAFGVIDVVRGAFGLAPGALALDSWLTAGRQTGMGIDDHRLDFQRQRVVEMVLATNESLVAYRRRHRSDIEFTLALQLVVTDVENPRAVAAAVRAVRLQAERLGWQVGVDGASELEAALATADLTTLAETAALLDHVWAGCDRLARDVVGSSLATPVDPRMMGRT